jgi:hypothetical protein
MRNIERRLRKLEERGAPRGPMRLVVRYEGSDWEDPDEEPEADFDENDPNVTVLTVQYVDMPLGRKTDEDDSQTPTTA